MSYTITHSQFSNAEGTAAVIQVEGQGACVITLADTDLWAQMLEAGTPDDAPALDAAPATPPPLSKEEARRNLAAALGISEADLIAILQTAGGQ